MAIGKFTIQSAQVWLVATGKDLFQDMTLPAAVDRDLAIDTIFVRCSEFPLLYTNPEFLMEAIGVWSRKKANTFERWSLALSEIYNPLHNYDRHEEWDDKTRGDGSALDKVSAFDSDTLRDNVKTETAGRSWTKRRGRAYGNIGVTTSATMLREEIETREQYNVYDLIANDFLKEFCMAIY